MYCRNCGAKSHDGETFCSKCGAIVSEQQTDSNIKQQSIPKKSYFGRNKLFIGIAIALVVLIAATVVFFVFLPKNDENAIANKMQQQTIAVTDAYYDAQIMTYKVLHTDNTQVSYDTWYRGIEKARLLWQEVESQSSILNDICSEGNDDILEDVGDAVGSLFGMGTAYAYSQSEINAVFDHAPAGKRLKTLAKYLGTDAKTAYNVLKNTQSEISKQAYADADFYQKCETTATVIKDAAKVGFFAGSVVMSGGATATYGLLEGACIIAGGTDLVLEIYEDGATIAYGEGNDATMVIKELRKGSKPLAMILGLSNLAGNAIDQLGYLSDSTLSLFQNDEVLGFNIKDKTNLEKVEMTGMDYADIAYWAQQNGVNIDNITSQDLTLTPQDVQDVNVDVPESTDLQTATTQTAVTQAPADGNVSSNDFDIDTYLVGTWESIDYWGGPLDENGHYTNYTADNKGYTYFMTITADGTATIDERNDSTGKIYEDIWVFQYVIDGTKINMYKDGAFQCVFYFNSSDGIIYGTDIQYLNTNGTYRTYVREE